MSRFLETFEQISFLAILLRQKRTLWSPTGLLQGASLHLCPSCLVSFTLDFHLENDFVAFVSCLREKREKKLEMFSDKIVNTHRSHVQNEEDFPQAVHFITN